MKQKTEGHYQKTTYTRPVSHHEVPFPIFVMILRPQNVSKILSN